jgi:hypothetical protein
MATNTTSAPAYRNGLPFFCRGVEAAGGAGTSTFFAATTGSGTGADFGAIVSFGADGGGAGGWTGAGVLAGAAAEACAACRSRSAFFNASLMRLMAWG